MTELANLLPALLGLMVGVITLISTHVAKRNYERQRQARQGNGTRPS